MAKKKKQVYTTIQIRKELNKHIKRLCEKNDLVASSITEKYWMQLISSSMSGSITL